MNSPTIFVATPSFRSADYIDRAIQSVVSQAGRFKLRYHVQDGFSDDGTVDRLSWWAETLSSQNYPIKCDGINFTFESAPDSGMYDALTHAFDKFKFPDDAFATWINSDDVILPGAFAALANIASTHKAKDVAWVTGQRNVATVEGIPFGSSWSNLHPTSSAIASGLCDGQHINFVQQEGTAFRGWLWNSVRKMDLFEDCKLAGDWLLWTKMAKHAHLHQLQFPLGRFQMREGQLSEDLKEYRSEIDRRIPKAVRRQSFIDFLRSDGTAGRHLFFVPETGRFVVREVKTNRYALAQEARFFQPELNDAIEEIVPETAVRNSSHVSSEDEIRGMIQQIAESEHHHTLLQLSSQLTNRHELLEERQHRFTRLAGRQVKKLVDDPNLKEASWKKVALRYPWKVGRWLAIRRYEKSKPD